MRPALGQQLALATLSASTSPSSRAKPGCSMFREPQLVDQVICTSTAPEAVTARRSARFYGSSPASVCEPRQDTRRKPQINTPEGQKFPESRTAAKSNLFEHRAL